MHEFTLPEVIMTIVGLGVTLAFGAWAAVVKRAADMMQNDIKNAVEELSKLRQELHKDRLLNERRFSRLEQIAGFHDPIHDND